MERLQFTGRWLPVSAAACACLLTAQLGATADQIVDSFDTESSVSAWSAIWGTSPELSWSKEDSTGSATSGSLRVAATYFTPEDNGWEQAVISRTFASPVIGAEFISVSVDVKVDPTSLPTGAGQYGYFELKRPDGTAMGGVNLSSTSWTTIRFQIAPTEGAVTGIIILNGNSGFTGQVIYYMDNFRFNAPPPPKTLIDTFDTEDTAGNWTAIWGTSPVIAWNSKDANGSATSGSLRVEADYFTPEDSGWEQMVISRTFETPIIGSEYVSVSVDLKVDPESVPTLSNQYGYFEMKRPDGSAIGGINLTSTEWTRITFPIPPTEGTLTGIIFQNGNGAFQGKVVYQVDNLQFTKSAAGSTAPVLSISSNRAAGLKLFASAPGQAYQRQNIVYAPSEDLANTLWWVNQPEAMTYSVTWSEFPGADQMGFQGHLMLVNDTGGGVTPDWNDANVILIEFQNVNTAGPDGIAGNSDDVVQAQARFLHKVNEAGGNAMLYRAQANAAAGPVGVLGQVQAPSMVGTWSMTLKQQGNGSTAVTLKAPNNATTQLVIPAEAAAMFEPSTKGVSALIGVQPNSDTRIGLSATLGGVKITQGAKVVVNENFATAELDSAVWVVRAQDAGGIVPTTSGLAYLVSWPLPDAGFSLRASASVAGPWNSIGTSRLVGARRLVLINQADAPGASAGFFQLKK